MSRISSPTIFGNNCVKESPAEIISNDSDITIWNGNNSKKIWQSIPKSSSVVLLDDDACLTYAVFSNLSSNTTCVTSNSSRSLTISISTFVS